MSYKNTLLLLILLVALSFNALSIELWVVAEGNAGLPFLIKSQLSDDQQHYYMFTSNGKLLHKLKSVAVFNSNNTALVTFDDGDEVEYQIYRNQEDVVTSEELVINEVGQVYTLTKRQNGVSNPTWCLSRFNSEGPLFIFREVNIDYSTGAVSATQLNGVVAHYTIAPSHVLPDLTRIPSVPLCSDFQ